MYKLLMLLPQAKIAIKYYNAIIAIIVLTDLFFICNKIYLFIVITLLYTAYSIQNCNIEYMILNNVDIE